MKHAEQPSKNHEYKLYADLQTAPYSKHILKMRIWHTSNRWCNTWKNILLFNTACVDDLFQTEKKLILNRIHVSRVGFDKFIYVCSNLLLRIYSRLKASSCCLGYHRSNLIAGLAIDGSVITVAFHLPLSQHALNKELLQAEGKHEMQYIRDSYSRLLHNNDCMVGVTINDHKVTTPLLGMKKDGDPKDIVKSICNSFIKLTKAIDE